MVYRSCYPKSRKDEGVQCKLEMHAGHLCAAHRGKELPEVFLESVIRHIGGQVANEDGVVSCTAVEGSSQSTEGGMQHGRQVSANQICAIFLEPAIDKKALLSRIGP